MTQTSASPQPGDRANAARKPRRLGVLFTVLVVLGGLYWLGKKPDTKSTEEQTEVPTQILLKTIDEWYLDGKVNVLGVQEGEQEPLITLVQLSPIPEGLDVNVMVQEGQWTKIGDIAQSELKGAGYRHSTMSQGIRDQWFLNYKFGTKSTGTITIGFRDDQLQLVSVLGDLYTPDTPANRVTRIQINGQDIPLPMNKSDFVALFGESGPKPERSRRGRPPQQSTETPATTTEPAPATPTESAQ